MSEELVTSCFQLITYVGTARSCFINAIQKAKEGNYEEAEKMIKEGNDAFNQGHDVHLDLLAKEAGGESSGGGLLMMHAEDQLMSAETFRVLAVEFIEVYKKMAE